MEKQIYLNVTIKHGLNTVQELDICIVFTCKYIWERMSLLSKHNYVKMLSNATWKFAT